VFLCPRCLFRKMNRDAERLDRVAEHLDRDDERLDRVAESLDRYP
jgi:uncharacterized protein (DUF2225 family)